MTPTISVALCTYNGASFLEAQLLSILGQTVRPAEIVLSDDNSSDDSVAIARAVVDGYDWGDGPATTLRVTQNATALGVSANFSQALLACTGEFVALCDQDDVWRDRHLELLSARLIEAPELMLVHSDAALVDADGASLGASLLESLDVTASERDEIHRGDGYRTLLRRNLVTGATTMIRRELLGAAVPFAAHWVHDEWLGIIAAATARFDLVDRQLTDYRQHGANQIGARKLSFRNKLSKLREPRAERNQHLVVRGQELVAKLNELGDRVSAPDRALAVAKLRHDEFRLGLPESPLRRGIPILREGARQYRDFSRGRMDMLRDLVQPAR